MAHRPSRPMPLKPSPPRKSYLRDFFFWTYIVTQISSKSLLFSSIFSEVFLTNVHTKKRHMISWAHCSQAIDLHYDVMMTCFG